MTSHVNNEQTYNMRKLTDCPFGPSGPVAPWGPGGPRGPEKPGAPAIPGAPYRRRQSMCVLYYTSRVYDLQTNKHNVRCSCTHHWSFGSGVAVSTSVTLHIQTQQTLNVSTNGISHWTTQIPINVFCPPMWCWMIVKGIWTETIQHNHAVKTSCLFSYLGYAFRHTCALGFCLIVSIKQQCWCDMYEHSQRFQKALELPGHPTLHEVLVPLQVHGHRWALLHPKKTNICIKLFLYSCQCIFDIWLLWEMYMKLFLFMKQVIQIDECRNFPPLPREILGNQELQLYLLDPVKNTKTCTHYL